MNRVILKAGNTVKILGYPYRLLSDVHAIGMPLPEVGVLSTTSMNLLGSELDCQDAAENTKLRTLLAELAAALEKARDHLHRATPPDTRRDSAVDEFRARLAVLDVANAALAKFKEMQ